MKEKKMNEAVLYKQCKNFLVNYLYLLIIIIVLIVMIIYDECYHYTCKMHTSKYIKLIRLNRYWNTYDIVQLRMILLAIL